MTERSARRGGLVVGADWVELIGDCGPNILLQERQGLIGCHSLFNRRWLAYIATCATRRNSRQCRTVKTTPRVWNFSDISDIIFFKKRK